MREIVLRNTIGNIERENKSTAQLLDIFRLINCPSPRNWTFKFEFDQFNINHLHISSDPPLAEREIENCLDGRIPLLYGFKSILFLSNSNIYRLHIDRKYINENERDTSYVFHNKEGEPVHGQLKIVGLPPLPIIQRPEEFRKWIHKHTWLGSYKYSGKEYKLKLIVYGKQYDYSNIRKDAESQYPSFKSDYSLLHKGLLLGDATIKLSMPTQINKIRHSKYGCFRIEHVDQAFWKKMNLNKYGGTQIEINNCDMEWYSHHGTNDICAVNNILDSLLSLSNKIRESKAYTQYLDNARKSKKELSARALFARQEKLSKASIVSVHGIKFMAVPNSESELVALYMKLEAAKKLPFECNVLEYTAKLGIDALANFRFQNTDDMTIYAPTEFEYKLENYFDHDHPTEQTKLIICWERDSDAKAYDIGDQTLKLMEDKAWLCYLKGDNKFIPVVILKNIPKLKII
jgi:hypothetical protein